MYSFQSIEGERMLMWQKRTGKVRIFKILIWISIHVQGLIKTFDYLVSFPTYLDHSIHTYIKIVLRYSGILLQQLSKSPVFNDAG